MTRKPLQGPLESRTTDSDNTSRGTGRDKAHKGAQSLCVTLPIPPSTNNAYVNAARGRKLTPRGRAYKADVMHLANAAGAQKMNLAPPLELVIELYFPDYRRRDADNFVKLIQDSLLEAVGHDDRGVEVLWVSKSLDRENPRAFVRLSSHDAVKETA